MGLSRVLSRRNWVQAAMAELDEPEPPPAEIQIDVLGVAARGEWHSTDDTRLLPLLRV
jgi:hypothetical protein